MTNWTQFTKRTNDPKLSALESMLDDAGIPHRRHGESFHAPILQVPAERLDDAWQILDPIDDIPDDDARWPRADRGYHDGYADNFLKPWDEPDFPWTG